MTDHITIKRTNGGGWVGVLRGFDCGLHITRNEATQRYTVWGFDDEVVIDNATRAEAERAASEYHAAA